MTLEEQLRRDFQDTLDKPRSHAAILIQYLQGKEKRSIFGLPYTITDGMLIIGAYKKQAIPSDKYRRQEPTPISLSSIIEYKRTNLIDNA